MALFDQLPHITSRIEAFTTTGGSSIGTGFFFDFEVPGKGTMTVLVTNKHVIKDADRVKIYVSRGSESGPVFGTFNSWNITGFSDIAVGHPSSAVDVAAFPVGGILNEMAKAGTPPYFRSLNASNIPSQAAIDQLTAIEDVFMIGYPTGLWDKSNNLPIVRRGITATPYGRDYEDRPEFMIDCACFPGSSGSPVVIANEGSFPMKNGGIKIGSRFHFLGLLWGGPQFTAQGDIVARPAPTSLIPIAMSQIPTNLGFCIKSRMVMDLAPPLLAKYG